MHRLGLVILALVISCGVTAAQSNPPYLCPTLSIEGPNRILKPGETAKFTAKVVAHGPELQIKYNWNISYGKILSGQGTSTIEVEKPPSGRLIATVNIRGTPDDSHCPFSHSEMVTWDGPAEAEKIITARGASLDAAPLVVDTAVTTLSVHSNDHLYIFLGHKRDTAEETLSKRESDLIQRLPENLEKTRISIVRVSGAADITEFWRMPPGADTPKCEQCNSNTCPKISVVGPAGITQSGDLMIFTTNPPLNEGLSFHWTISAGTIERGQGTQVIEVRTTREMNNSNVTATVEISGLPKDSAQTASETAAVYMVWHISPVDEFGKLPNNDIRGRLDALLSEVTANKNQIGTIILQYPKGSSQSKLLKRIHLVKDHIFRLRRFSKERIVIFLEPTEREYTKLYRLPPDVAQEICTGCKRERTK